MRIRSDDLWSNSQCGWMVEWGRRTMSLNNISNFCLINRNIWKIMRFRSIDFCHSTRQRNTCQDPVFKCQIQFDLSLFSEWWNKDTLNNSFCVLDALICFLLNPLSLSFSYIYISCVQDLDVT